MQTNKKLSREKKAIILALLAEGTPVNAVCRITKTGIVQVEQLILDAGAAAREWHNEHAKGLTVAVAEADEVHSYVHCHQGHLPRDHDNARDGYAGDCWLYSASGQASRFIIAWSNGPKCEGTADVMLSELWERVPGSFQLNTDCWKSFLTVTRRLNTDGRVSHCMEKKRFANYAVQSHIGNVQRVASCKRTAKAGKPDLSRGTISHQERIHLTFRQQMRRFTRRTIAYSKTYEHHVASTNLYIWFYNWSRRSESRALAGKTPAMAQGLADKPVSIETFVDYTEKYLAKLDAGKWEAAFAARYGAGSGPIDSIDC